MKDSSITTMELVTIIGVILTFIIGVFNLVVTFRNVKKTSFINSITASRIKYVQEFRENISRFCALANYNYNLQNRISLKLNKEANLLKYQIFLCLDPEDKVWHEKIRKLIDDIMNNSEVDTSEEIENLIIITQFLLELEWEGAKQESEKGILSKIDKQIICNKYERRYNIYKGEKK